MEDEEFLITNLDDGERYKIDDVIEKFNVVKIIDQDSKADAKIREGEEEEEDSKYYDSKLTSPFSNSAKSTSSYISLSLPEGARLSFSKIAAVGTTRDLDDKAYSVYYLDVRCNVASPSSWFVYRRYSQFRRLSDILRSEGYYVPVLPPKKLLGTFSTDFVQQRKIDLENWLIALAEMHVNYPGSKDPQYHPYYRKFLTEDANKPPQPLVRIYLSNEQPINEMSQSDNKSKPVKVNNFN